MPQYKCGLDPLGFRRREQEYVELSSSFFELRASRGATDQELFLLLRPRQGHVAELPQQLCGPGVVVFFFGTRKEFNEGRQLSPWGCVPQK